MSTPGPPAHRSAPRRTSPVVLALLATVLMTVLLLAISSGHPPRRRPAASPVGTSAPTSTPAPPRPAVSAGRVLAAWDARRAAAYASQDARALVALYLPTSTAREADLRLLQRYADRGLRVTALRTQVLSVRVLHRDDRVLRLRIVDRLAGVSVEDGARCLVLPHDQPRTRTVELRRGGRVDRGPSTWRVASVAS